MPIVEVDPTEVQQFDLKSAPPDGFVKMRRLTWGQKLQRREMMKMSVHGGKGKGKDFEGEMAMANKQITQYEFQHTIIEHNLQKRDGSPLNFSNPVDFASLDPRVGDEIETRIQEMNEFDDEDDQGN